MDLDFRILMLSEWESQLQGFEMRAAVRIRDESPLSASVRAARGVKGETGCSTSKLYSLPIATAATSATAATTFTNATAATVAAQLASLAHCPLLLLLLPQLANCSTGLTQAALGSKTLLSLEM